MIAMPRIFGGRTRSRLFSSLALLLARPGTALPHHRLSAAGVLRTQRRVGLTDAYARQDRPKLLAKRRRPLADKPSDGSIVGIVR